MRVCDGNPILQAHFPLVLRLESRFSEHDLDPLEGSPPDSHSELASIARCGGWYDCYPCPECHAVCVWVVIVTEPDLTIHRRLSLSLCQSETRQGS